MHNIVFFFLLLLHSFIPLFLLLHPSCCSFFLQSLQTFFIFSPIVNLLFYLFMPSPSFPPVSVHHSLISVSLFLLLYSSSATILTPAPSPSLPLSTFSPFSLFFTAQSFPHSTISCIMSAISSLLTQIPFFTFLFLLFLHLLLFFFVTFFLILKSLSVTSIATILFLSTLSTSTRFILHVLSCDSVPCHTTLPVLFFLSASLTSIPPPHVYLATPPSLLSLFFLSSSPSSSFSSPFSCSLSPTPNAPPPSNLALRPSLFFISISHSFRHSVYTGMLSPFLSFFLCTSLSTTPTIKYRILHHAVVSMPLESYGRLPSIVLKQIDVICIILAFCSRVPFPSSGRFLLRRFSVLVILERFVRFRCYCIITFTRYTSSTFTIQLIQHTLLEPPRYFQTQLTCM